MNFKMVQVRCFNNKFLNNWTLYTLFLNIYNERQQFCTCIKGVYLLFQQHNF